MKLEELATTVQDAVTVRRVFGDPVERDGVTVIPVAAVSGGGGGGAGHDANGQEGEGGGFGVQARPAGVYVIRDGDVSWRPALDVGRITAVTFAALVVLALARVRAARHRARARTVRPRTSRS